MKLNRSTPAYLERHLSQVSSHDNASGSRLSLAVKAYRGILSHYYGRIIPTDASILEIGCGDGELLSRFKNKGISGIDVSIRQIESARKKILHGTFYVQAGETIDLAGAFD